MRPFASRHRSDAYDAAIALMEQAEALALAMNLRREDTEGAARDLLIPAEAALAKAQEVVSHLRARLGEKSDA